MTLLRLLRVIPRLSHHRHLPASRQPSVFSSSTTNANAPVPPDDEPGPLTYKQSDFITYDPANILQEPEEERESFQKFLDTYGDLRFARPAPVYPDREFLASKDPEEWRHVERLIPCALVPPIPKKDVYPSGFVPVRAKPGDYPYYVTRTANHMLPVYIKYSRKQQVLATTVRKVDGNLFVLRDELKELLFKRYRMDFMSQVAEVYGRVMFRGDFEQDFKDFLLDKGF